MLTFEGFQGINNVQPESRLKASDLLIASNVDIGLTGEISRRSGFTQISDQCHKNLHEAPGFMLATVDGVLTAIHQDGMRVALDSRLGPQRIWYCNLPDGRVTYSNGTVQGVTDGRGFEDRCVPVPGNSAAQGFCFGQLDSGQYRYCLTYLRLSDRLEGSASPAIEVFIDQGQGLQLDGLPALEGHAINVYLTGRDGEAMYLAGSTLTGSFAFAGSNAELVLPCRTVGAMPFPLGSITAYWRGRVLVAQGNVLWASRPSSLHLAEWRDFKPMESEITAVVAVDTGIYVGTKRDLIFLGGETFDGLSYMSTKRGPVVLGSGIGAPGKRILFGEGTGAGSAMLCIAGGGVVAGFNGGQTECLTEGRFKTKALEVSAAFREVDGIPQYMAVPHA